MTEADLAARYPFLPGSSRLLGDLAPSLQELVSDPGYEPVRSLARTELLSALASGTSSSAWAASSFDAARPEERVLAFLYARMMVAVAPSSQRVARRWCQGEARRVGEMLGRPEAAGEELVALARALDLEVEESSRTPGRYLFDLPTYVQLAAPLREDRFRLASQDLRGGKVEVGRSPSIDLLQQGVSDYLAEEVVGLRLDPDLQGSVRTREAETLARVAALAPAFSPSSFGGVVRPELFPPCMREIRSLLDRGQNISHAGRFALASFMNKVGAEVDAIVDAYRGAPNFKESVTRYQVGQIAHHDGGAGYTPPDCATMASNGLCFRDKDDLRPSLCIDPGKLRNPLNYYRLRTRSPGRAAPSSVPGPSTRSPSELERPLPTGPSSMSSALASRPSPAPPPRKEGEAGPSA